MPGLAKESFSWGEISRQLNEAELLGLQRGPALSFIALWVAFERMMRFQSRSIALPIDRLESPAMMIGQLYSNGELSIEQFEMATNLVRIRNQVFHGLDVPADDLKRLHAPGS